MEMVDLLKIPHERSKGFILRKWIISDVLKLYCHMHLRVYEFKFHSINKLYSGILIYFKVETTLQRES